ncbi:MAG: nitroreductase family protein [Eubacterium sp.]|nr:nitroreductase family protein [Eubacterium sp.]
METRTCIETRRSVRKFTDQAVTPEVLEQIVATAAWAPSWKNTQVVRYHAVCTKEIKDRIAREGVMDFTWNTKIMEGAPVLVVMTMITGRSGFEKDGSYSTSKGAHWQSFDAGIAAQTFCLAAHDLGLGSVILGVIDEAAIKGILNIPEEEEIAALIPLGYPAEEPKAPRRKAVEELLTVD